jgi:hypothetical protein
MSKWKYDEKADTRNYDLEARELVKGLRGSQLYDMYGIVNKQLQRSVSPKRERELQAVKKAIENYPSIDKYRLDFTLNGYKSEMAQTGNPKDGKASIHRKKV